MQQNGGYANVCQPVVKFRKTTKTTLRTTKTQTVNWGSKRVRCFVVFSFCLRMRACVRFRIKIPHFDPLVVISLKHKFPVFLRAWCVICVRDLCVIFVCMCLCVGFNCACVGFHYLSNPTLTSNTVLS